MMHGQKKKILLLFAKVTYLNPKRSSSGVILQNLKNRVAFENNSKNVVSHGIICIYVNDDLTQRDGFY
jgi:hypothetical protein